MIESSNIRSRAESLLQGTDMFVVDVKVSGGGDIEVLIDSDTSVSIDDCVKLSRSLEEDMDRETEDFALTVASSGIGQPLKVLRQYRKLIGKPVEVVLKSGVKVTGELKDANQDRIEVSFTEKVAVEGKKRKETVERVEQYSMDEIKSTVEHLDFK